MGHLPDYNHFGRRRRGDRDGPRPLASPIRRKQRGPRPFDSRGAFCWTARIDDRLHLFDGIVTLRSPQIGGAERGECNRYGGIAGRMLPEPYSSDVAPLFKEYARLRVSNKGDSPGTSTIAEAVRRSLAIQETLWRTGMDAATVNSQVVPSGLFIQALNVMIDVHEERLMAAQSQVPSVVFVMLDGIAIVAFGFAGYGLELANARCRAGMWIMAVMMGSVIMLVADLDRPQSGFITVDQQPLLDIIDTIK
jgi:hypothetical protein